MRTPAPIRERGWHNATPTRDLDERHTRWLWVVLLGFVAALLPTAVYVLQKVSFTQVRYRIEDLRERQDKLAEREQWLRIERATLSALPEVDNGPARSPALTRPRTGQVTVVRQTRPASGTPAPRAPDFATAVR
jgi:hypothetical protein